MTVNNLTKLVSLNQAFAILALFSFVILSISYYMQYFGGHIPCKLCIAQRVPFFLVSFTSIIGIFSSQKKLLLLLNICCLSALFFIASYHFLIQLGVMPDRCVTHQPASIATFKEGLFKPTMPCSTVSWSLLGLSPSALNVLISLFCITLLLRVRSSLGK
jgi:disulfide bond formation protein DsbB